MAVVLVVLVVVVLGGLLFAGFAGGALFSIGERMRKRAEAHAPEILDKAFDGTPDVVFKVNLESLSYETVLLGARDRGYRLLSQTDTTPDSKTLVFTRRA